MGIHTKINEMHDSGINDIDTDEEDEPAPAPAPAVDANAAQQEATDTAARNAAHFEQMKREQSAAKEAMLGKMSADEREAYERDEQLKNMHDQSKSKHALKTTKAFKGSGAAAVMQGRGGRGRGGRGAGSPTRRGSPGSRHRSTD